MKKRLLSLITAVSIVFALLPAFALPALAADWNGSGTAADPYLINTIEELQKLAANVNGGTTYEDLYFKLTADVKLNDNVLKEDGALNGDGSEHMQWVPIGNSSSYFKGTFDGDNHTISGLYFNNANTDYVGLFGYIDGTIKNIGVADSYFNGCYYVGGVCGWNSNGTIMNSSNSGTVLGRNRVSGVCGKNKGTITDCSNSGTISGRSMYVGGVCGDNSNTITNCSNSGTISSSFVGGVCGNNSGTITNSYNIGLVSGSGKCHGGVCGDNSGTIMNSYNIGQISGNTAGGVCGDNSGTTTNSYNLQSACSNSGYGINKTAEQFASGEIAWLLQNGQSSWVWGQALKTDTSPVLSDNAAKKVYKVAFMSKNGGTKYNEYSAAYANYNGKVVLPESPDGFEVTKWSQSQSVDGDEFTADTQVTGDMTVYAAVRELYGESETVKEIMIPKNMSITQDLSDYIKYSGTTSPKEKFTYEITGGNDTLKASINGDILTIPAIQQFGEHTLSITAAEKTPQISLFSVNSLEKKPIQFTVKIIITNKQYPTVTVPTAKTLTYTGTAQELVEAGKATGGTIKYSLDGTEYSTNIPTGKNAGDYTVWYKVDGESDYVSISAKRITVTISKATVSVPTGLVGTKGQRLSDIFLLPYGWKWTAPTTTLTETGEHGYQAVYTPDDTINYNTVTENITVTVGSEKIGTAENPYLIPDIGTLKAFRDYVNARNKCLGMYFKLTADIRLNNNVLKEDGTLNGDGSGFEQWTPIGTSLWFSGIFDGDNHTISGLYFSDSNADNVGLFSETSNGVIKNVNVSDSYFSGNERVGGVCGWNSSSTIMNCSNSGTVSGRSQVGGVCGSNSGATGTITNSYNSGSVSGSGIYQGGVCGNNNSGTIANSYNIGTVSGDIAGGVCGNTNVAVTNSYNLQSACSNEGNGTNKTMEEFASGEVAWLLQNGQASQAWGQVLKIDTYPVLSGDAAKKVYKVAFMQKNDDTDYSEYASAYANPNGTVKLPETLPNDTYKITRWSQTQSADGTEFTESTPVTGDMSIYAVTGQEQYGETDADKIIVTTYGTSVTQDLSAYVGYAGTTASASKFDYAINGEYNNEYFSISGDILTVGNTVPVGEYTLSITATEKTPQITTFALNNAGTKPVSFTVTVAVNKADPVVVNKVLKKIIKEDTKDGSEATAVLSQINMNGNAIRNIIWTYTAADKSEYKAEYTQEISGESTVYFGIVVPALLEAKENQTTDEITVNID